MTGHDPSRVSPFGYPRIKAWSTAPRGFSQPPTSFIGIWRQGIHRWLFIAWEFTCTVSFKDARARSAVLKGRCGRDARRNPSQRLSRRDRVSGSTLAGRPSGHGARSAARPGKHQRDPLPAGPVEGRLGAGRVAAPSKRNSDAPAGHGVRWCPRLRSLGIASSGIGGVGLFRDRRITNDRRRSSRHRECRAVCAP